MLHFKEVLQMKTKMKYQVSCDYDSILCSGIRSTVDRMDNDSSHFSFTVFGISPIVFAESIESVVKNALVYEEYYKPQKVVIPTSRPSDEIIIKRECSTIAISRGSFKILYHAGVDGLIGLTLAIRKAYNRYEKSTLG